LPGIDPINLTIVRKKTFKTGALLIQKTDSGTSTGFNVENWIPESRIYSIDGNNLTLSLIYLSYLCAFLANKAEIFYIKVL